MQLTKATFTKTNKIIFKNQNETSKWWKQLDTDVIVSPTNSRYNFYLLGQQNLETGKWSFEYVSTDSDYRDAMPEITNPVEAKKWYEQQR